MNQEVIAKIIKNIRLKNKLTQEEFANKYNVTYQAVSKWERGLSIPDIEILSKICKDYNISMDEIFKTKKKKTKYVILVLVITLSLVACLTIIIKGNETFKFKNISTTCENFNISGNLAYDKKSSHLHVSNVSYCGDDKETYYTKIECSLYEKDKEIIKELINCDYKGNEKITLDNFLKSIDFNISDFSEKCNLYNDESLYLEINATDNNKTINYKIPLKINDECK